MISLRFIFLFFFMYHYTYGQKISPDSLMAMGEINLPFDSAQLSVFDNPNNTGGCYNFYQKGVKVAFKCFYNSNNIESEIRFDSLERETGKYRMWFDSGQLKWLIEYDAGEYDGKYQVWDSTGFLTAEGTMEQGRGIINKFNSKGEVYQRDYVHNSGFIYRKQGVCPDGRIEYDIDYRKESDDFVRYDCETRNIIEKGTTSLGAKNGYWEYFDKNGNLIETRRYEYGELIEKEVLEK